MGLSLSLTMSNPLHMFCMEMIDTSAIVFCRLDSRVGLSAQLTIWQSERIVTFGKQCLRGKVDAVSQDNLHFWIRSKKSLIERPTVNTGFACYVSHTATLHVDLIFHPGSTMDGVTYNA